jgi:hypothetical protein
MKWTATFTGRKLGAIGTMQQFHLNLEADTYKKALTKFWDEVYKTHEHIARMIIGPNSDQED